MNTEIEASAVTTIAVSPGQRVNIGGHIYTVMGHLTSPYLKPVGALDRSYDHRTHGADCPLSETGGAK